MLQLLIIINSPISSSWHLKWQIVTQLFSSVIKASHKHLIRNYSDSNSITHQLGSNLDQPVATLIQACALIIDLKINIPAQGSGLEVKSIVFVFVLFKRLKYRYSSMQVTWAAELGETMMEVGAANFIISLWDENRNLFWNVQRFVHLFKDIRNLLLRYNF